MKFHGFDFFAGLFEEHGWVDVSGLDIIIPRKSTLDIIFRLWLFFRFFNWRDPRRININQIDFQSVLIVVLFLIYFISRDWSCHAFVLIKYTTYISIRSSWTQHIPFLKNNTFEITRLPQRGQSTPLCLFLNHHIRCRRMWAVFWSDLLLLLISSLLNRKVIDQMFNRWKLIDDLAVSVPIVLISKDMV